MRVAEAAEGVAVAVLLRALRVMVVALIAAAAAPEAPAALVARLAAAVVPVDRDHLMAAVAAVGAVPGAMQWGRTPEMRATQALHQLSMRSQLRPERLIQSPLALPAAKLLFHGTRNEAYKTRS